MAPRLRSPALAAVLLATVLAAGCGDDGGAAGAGDELPATGCGEDRQERVDPGSAAHVLAGAADPGPDAYATDPPTSGPHTPGPPRSGVLDEPLTRPEQVGHLEAGGILVQHAGLTDAQVAELAQVAGGGVAVVPNPDLSAPIVVTAWLRTMPCSTPDTEALQEFVTVHQGQAPGSDG